MAQCESAAVVTAALSTDVVDKTALVDAIRAVAWACGPIAVARAQRAIMQGSEIRESHREEDNRVQDPYCIRC